MDQQLEQSEHVGAGKEATAARADGGAPGDLEQVLLALQGSAGNEAVSALLHELGMDGAPEAAGPPKVTDDGPAEQPPAAAPAPAPAPEPEPAPAEPDVVPDPAPAEPDVVPAPPPAPSAGPASSTAASTGGGAGRPAPSAAADGPAGEAGADLAPAPDPAPAVVRAPTITDPSSGVDWEAAWGEFNSPDTLSGANVTRAALEAGRLLPGWGLLSGVAADLLSAVQDFDTLPDSAPPELEALLGARSVVQVLNNALGHIAYVDQLIQDALAGSVVGAELVPVTAAINEAVMSAKVTVSGVQFLLDILLEASALYQREHAPPGADRDAYSSMASNFAANLVGDVVGITLDIVSLATAGVDNDGPIRTGAGAVKAAFPVAKTVGGMILQYAQGLFNVFGGSGVSELGGVDVVGPAILDPTGMHRLAAFAVIRAELGQARGAYEVGDRVLDMIGESVDAQVEGFRQLAMQFTDGQDPFLMMRDAAVAGLDHMRLKVASAHEMGAMATTGAEKADQIRSMADDASAAVASVQVPDVRLPEVELGDGLLADAGELFASSAAAAANLVIEQALAAVDQALATARAAADEAIEEVRSHADEAAEFLQVLTDVANQQVTALEVRIDSVSDGLAQCESAEQFIELLVNQALDLAGVSAEFRVDDLRALWADVGVALEEAEQWALEQEQAAEAAALGGGLDAGSPEDGGTMP